MNKIIATLSIIILAYIFHTVFLTDQHIDWRLKLIHPFTNIIFYLCGMYNGGTFSRKCIKLLEYHAPTTDNSSLDGVQTTDFDIPYFSQNSSHTIPARLFEPIHHRNGSKLPLMFFFHGGGFVIGSGKAFHYDRLLRNLARGAEIMILSVDYRLSPEHPFPAALFDSFSSLLWINELINKGGDSFAHKIDTTKIIVMGDSAGATLAYGMTFILRDNKLPLFSHDKDAYMTVNISYNITYQVLVYPPIGLKDSESRRSNHNYFLNKDIITWFWKSYTAPLHANKNDIYYKNYFFFPLESRLTNLPEALIITADYDILRDDGITYADELRKAGVKVHYKNYSSVHGFYSMLFLRESEEAQQYTIDMLRKKFT